MGKIDITFGARDPRGMPSHFFSGAKAIDYASAKKANTSKQDHSVAPRHWYVDATFDCEDCGREFTWSAQEQRLWFERFRFFVDSEPRHCRSCRSRRRRIKRLKKDYDALVGRARDTGDIEDMRQVVGLVDHLERLGTMMPVKMRQTRDEYRQRVYKT